MHALSSHCASVRESLIFAEHTAGCAPYMDLVVIGWKILWSYNRGNNYVTLVLIFFYMYKTVIFYKKYVSLHIL